MDDTHGGRYVVGAVLVVGLGMLVFSQHYRAVAVTWIGEQIWRSPR